MKPVDARLAALMLFILFGCTESVSNTQPDSDRVYFLEQKPSDAPSMAALNEGRLILDEKCLYIQRDTVDTRHAAVWPNGFSLDDLIQSILILNENKEVVAQVGDVIRVGGGEVRLTPQQLEETIIGDAFQCEAPYWIISWDIEVINQ